MNFFSLRSLIDDILLLVRNNNISESEDLSRALIAGWILAYKAALLKQRKDQEKQQGNDDAEDSSLASMLETRGPYELKFEESKDDTPLFRRETIDEIKDLLDGDPSNIYSVQDQNGHVIQFMSELRKHYHVFRKYTGKELTYWYENKHIHIHGIEDFGKLKYIYVTGLFSEDSADAEDMDEDDVKVPGWMIPDIKKNILANELAFMVQRVSDDDNNSTLDGIKPQTAGQQYINEK